MKNLLYTFLIVLFTASTIQAQTYINEDISRGQELIEQQIDLNLQNVSTTANNQNGNLLGTNNIFLAQVGDNNQVNFNVDSTNGGTAVLLQNGSDNEIDTNFRAQSYNVSVLQDGDGNLLRGINTSNPESLEAQVSQQGNDQTLIWDGQNSISSKLRVNMTGEGQEVIIRSFN